MSALSIFWLLMIGHYLCDFPLQGEFLALGKNHKKPLPGIPWYHCLFAHAFIHAGAVSLITGSIVLGISELLAHILIDFGKCNEWYDFSTDQALHVICKVALIFALFFWHI